MSQKPKSKKPNLDVLNEIQHSLENIQIELKEIKEIVMENKKQIQENKTISLDAIEKQNKTVCQVLAEHNISLKSIITSFWSTPKYIKQFPIETEEGLLKWEEDITEENKNEMVKTVTAIMGEKGLSKGLSSIISQKVLLEYNLNGTHKKNGLKQFKKIMDVLFLSYTSSSMNDNQPESFDKNLRIALKKIKNRHFKDECLKKKTLSSSEILLDPQPANPQQTNTHQANAQQTN